ncbi:MAG: Hsp20/alpha crystallin family protein [Desulfomonilaceae bacterium]|nr:Hsp20/alpha crystallin family protein [Desulfomonilaceae bacterium]
MFGWRSGGDPAWAEFDRLRRGMDELMTALSRGTRTAAAPLWAGARLFPLVNLVRDGDSFVVTAEIPGMNVEDLNVHVEGDTLTLKGARKALDLGQDVSYHRRERSAGTFQRSLVLPNAIDAQNVKANYKDGVLTVTLPIEKAALPRQISVSTE